MQKAKTTVTYGIAVAALALASSFITTALAASPHFIGTPRIVKNPNGSLTANFKAAGLANIVTGAFLTSSGGTLVATIHHLSK